MNRHFSPRMDAASAPDPDKEYSDDTPTDRLAGFIRLYRAGPRTGSSSRADGRRPGNSLVAERRAGHGEASGRGRGRGRDYWIRNIHRPSVLAFPAKANHSSGAAIGILPGGAHKLLVWTNEGTKVATALNRMGVSAFVLKYRLANEAGSPYSVEGDAADDARRAVRWVRAHASDYGIDPERVGVMGFRKAGVSAELHMYADSDHAFNLDESNRILILHWPDRLADWLADGGWLGPSSLRNR